jgi:hypothetical protein
VRLPAALRSFPLRGLMARRYRGECVSTPHQGRSELHRYPTRVLRRPRVPAWLPGDQSPERKARFLINGSHLGPVIRGLDLGVADKGPQGLAQPEDLPPHPCGLRHLRDVARFQPPLHRLAAAWHVGPEAGVGQRAIATPMPPVKHLAGVCPPGFANLRRARSWPPYPATDAPNTAADATSDTRDRRSTDP